jgi:hypothetical protein
MYAYKQCQAQFKADGKPGEFRAIFSTFDLKDADGDVTLAGAFQDGAAVRIAAWGHNWNVPAVGRGTIHSDDREAWVDGAFNLATVAGREHYETVKNLAGLQSWSYGYDVVESSPGKWHGEQVRFLKRLVVHEVSPVMLGAGVTRTESIKSFRGGSVVHGAALTPGELGVELDFALIEARIAEREGAPAATGAPMTRAQFRIAQEMAREGITYPLAFARLGAAIESQAQQLLERQPWLDCGSGFPCASFARARAAVARWWAQPF